MVHGTRLACSIQKGIQDMLRRHSKVALLAAGLVLASTAIASSHREAPGITKTPKLDNSDFYMFRSYETGRAGNVTLLANFQPLQDAYGGPNYFMMDDNAVYAIHIDNNGDSQPDITYEFRFKTELGKNNRVIVNGLAQASPLSNNGPFDQNDTRAQNVRQFYSVKVVTPGGSVDATNPFSRQALYPKPFDNIGPKSIANYAQYADAHISPIGYQGCATSGRVFVGQRKEGFSVALGEVFDLVNLNPVGPANGERNDLYDKNVTTIALEIPISCLANGTEPVIGAWSTARVASNGVAGAQVSRLGMPLVNEVVIGLPDKDKFNASSPSGDGQFLKYVTNPVLPELLEALFGVTAPNRFPRNDLVAAFLTGIPGLNQPANVTPSEMLRLNTGTAVTAANAQSNLGVLGSDLAGFPNGRRPGDDVVDIELRVAMGVLLPSADAPSGQLPYTDGATVSAADFRTTFPYLQTPIGGDQDI